MTYVNAEERETSRPSSQRRIHQARPRVEASWKAGRPRPGHTPRHARGRAPDRTVAVSRSAEEGREVLRGGRCSAGPFAGGSNSRAQHGGATKRSATAWDEAVLASLARPDEYTTSASDRGRDFASRRDGPGVRDTARDPSMPGQAARGEGARRIAFRFMREAALNKVPRRRPDARDLGGDAEALGGAPSSPVPRIDCTPTCGRCVQSAGAGAAATARRDFHGQN